ARAHAEGGGMVERARVALAGIGNNVSALVQGVYFYRELIARQGDETLPGIRRPVIDGLGVGDLTFVAGFDVAESKVGQDISEAILTEPNNYPRLDVEVPALGVVVEQGIIEGREIEAQIARVAGVLAASRAEVLLYALPAGRPWAAVAYAEAALRAGVGFINTTPDVIARDNFLLERFTAAGLPLIGDDLASHFGTSVVHRALLQLLAERGLTLVSSYQFNLGGNQDFKNLVDHADEKRQSKLNALAADEPTRDKVRVMPFGYLPELGDRKIAHVNIEGLGWAGMPVSLDVKLAVYDSSGAAGVTIDLIRLAASARRAAIGGFVESALGLLKSPPGTRE
ncbi:MAG: inositol-3-phosphate synthase, partial [Vicinamibacterales bacterium]